MRPFLAADIVAALHAQNDNQIIKVYQLKGISRSGERTGKCGTGAKMEGKKGKY